MALSWLFHGNVPWTDVYNTRYTRRVPNGGVSIRYGCGSKTHRHPRSRDPDGTAQAVNALAQVYWIAAHYKTVVLIQVEMAFLSTKVGTS